MAPEVIRHDAYATQADVWSWACTACEVLTLQRPYTSRYLTPIQVALKVSTDGMRPDIPHDIPDALFDLLRQCLAFEAFERPSFAIIAESMRSIAEAELKKNTQANGWGSWLAGKTMPGQ